MPIRGSTQRRLSFHGAGRDHPDWVGRKRSYPLVESVEEGCVSLCSGLYWRACQRRNVPFPSLP